MKILIFESWLNSPQYETGLEIAEKHINKNDDVTYVNIGGYLPFLEWQTSLKPNSLNFIKHRISFHYKIKRTKRIINKKIGLYTNTLLNKNQIKALNKKYTFNNLDELKNYKWEDVDIGMGTASSLISITNDLEPDVKDEYSQLINYIILSSKIVKKSFQKWLKKVKPDLVYFRNGRVALYRPILRVCQQKNQNFLIHDRGCNKNHYKISNDLRHNFDMVNDEILEAWDNEKDSAFKETNAKNFYSDRIFGKEQGWQSFITNQKKELLPDEWNNSEFNITFFNSSLGEFAAIDQSQFKNELFKNQFEAILFIADSIKDCKNKIIYLRLHPNLINQSKKEQLMWSSLEHPKIRIIKPTSKVDTYSLIDNSNLIISYLSTAGIEAAYVNKPSIVLNKSYYHKLGSVYYPKTKDELVKLLRNKNLPPLSNLGALKYGYYMNTFGDEYVYFKPISLLKGVFKGVDLQKEHYLVNIILKIRNILKRL